MDVVVRTRMAVSLGLKLGERKVNIYTQEMPNALELDAGDLYLAGMANVYAKMFCDKNNKDRMMIIVRGKPTEQRARFMYHLSGLVDVFVEPEEQCQADLGFFIRFEDPF